MMGAFRTFTWLAICISTVSLRAEKYIDFEKEMRSDFVLETKRIFIDGFPDAFNPSIVPWNDAFLMSFRTGEGASCGMSGESGDTVEDADEFLLSFRFRDPVNLVNTNQIGLVFLNRDFQPISWPQVIKINYSLPTVAERQQDPRLVKVGGRLFMVYSNMMEGWDKKEIRRMFVVELFYENKNHARNFVASDPVLLSRYEGEDEQKWTKNWVPFGYDERLHLSHTLNPHRVFLFNGTSECATIGKSKAIINWDFGELRGGTQALLDGEQYLAIFHSSKEMKTIHSDGKKIQHYFMGAYTFESKPPFAVTAVSRVPIVGENFYSGEVYKDKTWKPLRVVFPGGLIVDHEKVWVAYGRQDHEVWIATMDKKKLLESLAPVQ